MHTFTSARLLTLNVVGCYIYKKKTTENAGRFATFNVQTTLQCRKFGRDPQEFLESR